MKNTVWVAGALSLLLAGCGESNTVNVPAATNTAVQPGPDRSSEAPRRNPQEAMVVTVPDASEAERAARAAKEAAQQTTQAVAGAAAEAAQAKAQAAAQAGVAVSEAMREAAERAQDAEKTAAQAAAAQR